MDNMTVLEAASAAFGQAVDHIAGECPGCRPGDRLPQLCPDGQALATAALAVLFVVPPADPFGPAASAYLIESARETAAEELTRFADVMEVHRLDQGQGRRDAWWVRYAARIVRDGLAAHILAVPNTPAAEEFLSEVDRLREALFEAKADEEAAVTWADSLAYKIAPPEVIGRHEDEDRYPWGDALDLVTPAAEVEELRRSLDEAVRDGDRLAGMLELKAEQGAVVTIPAAEVWRMRVEVGELRERVRELTAPTAAKACGRAQSTGEPCPDHPVVVDPQQRLAELEDERARLLALLPTVPPLERGTPNEIGAALAEFSAFELVASVLGVKLPGSSM